MTTTAAKGDVPTAEENGLSRSAQAKYGYGFLILRCGTYCGWSMLFVGEIERLALSTSRPAHKQNMDDVS